MSTIDRTGWSGEGEFTARLVDRLAAIDAIEIVRVEDAPSTRSDATYNFISNEVFVGFATVARRERFRRFGILPGLRERLDPAMTLADLERLLAAAEDIGSPDYSDEGMLQYLRSERIVPPYQTRGYKLVELVRVYEAGNRKAEVRS
jgi:hypothetical protein